MVIFILLYSEYVDLPIPPDVVIWSLALAWSHQLTRKRRRAPLHDFIMKMYLIRCVARACFNHVGVLFSSSPSPALLDTGTLRNVSDNLFLHEF